MHDSERHQQLALVLMDALGLHIEDRCGIDIDICDAIDDARQPLLVFDLGDAELGLETLIVGELFDPDEPIEVGHPGFADRPIEQLRQTRDSPAEAIAAA